MRKRDEPGKGANVQRLHERIGLLMVRGQFRSALELLDRVIEDPLPLFQGETWVTEERRLAWLYRIELLRGRQRLFRDVMSAERVNRQEEGAGGEMASCSGPS